VLLYALAISGVGELSAYVTLASGESLSPGLLGEALIETRVGHVWLARFGFALLTAALVTVAARSGRTIYWWAATGSAALLLMTLTQLSHAAAEGRFLPFLADWLHVAAATIWVGGLLSLMVVFDSGSLEAIAADRRAKLRERALRRFSRLAICAVMVLAATGLYAILLHVPNLAALVGTAYGRALLTKLCLLTLVLALGGISFLLRRRGPYGRLLGAELILALGVFVATGFLTSLPPATAVKQEAPPEDVEVLEVQLDPVGDSVTSGTATFREDMASETAGLCSNLRPRACLRMNRRTSRKFTKAYAKAVSKAVTQGPRTPNTADPPRQTCSASICCRHRNPSTPTAGLIRAPT
jgi:copper transport protein